MRECESCQRSLDGGEITLPYEDGANSDAYVQCPHCGRKNTVYGFGGDDD